MFEIPFKGLKEGLHKFKVDIEDSFFEEFEMLEAKGGNVEVNIELDKKPVHLELKINITGNIFVACDRCLDYFYLPVNYKGALIVKFSENEQEDDDEVMILHPNESSLNLKQYVYESIGISIPYKKVHPQDQNGIPGCDPNVIKYLNNSSEEDMKKEIDPRWSELEKLLKNKKTN